MEAERHLGLTLQIKNLKLNTKKQPSAFAKRLPIILIKIMKL